ncbi:hypothetical protein D3C78_176460 [compost metagenome]
MLFLNYTFRQVLIPLMQNWGGLEHLENAAFRGRKPSGKDSFFRLFPSDHPQS